MATIVATNIFVLNSRTILSTPTTIENAWNDRLAGISNIDPLDGTWEITNISERFDGEELVVLGISRSTNNNYAVASRVKTV
jgi:hypothetical protein